jgi:hypothetical protein
MHGVYLKAHGTKKPKRKQLTEKKCGALKKMKVAGQKLMFMALVLVVATFPSEGRKLLDAPYGQPDFSTTPPKHLHYGMLPKLDAMKSSSSSSSSSSPPPPPPHNRFGTVFHGLSKGPVPPSGPSGGTDPSMFHPGVMKKGHIPPSAPNAGQWGEK